MNNTAHDVLELINENDIKFVQLNFCDLFGLQKNISIMAKELRCAFEDGVSFDAHAIKGFRDVTRSDLLLFPDPATLAVMPWRPGSGRVARFYCEIKNPDGSAFSRDSRSILKRVAERADKMGYACKIGAECEFYLFKTGEDGAPVNVPFDQGGYLDIPPLDKSEDIRREICLTLEEMGIAPETSHHEQGPGQNEIDFKFSGALSCADDLQTFKSVVKSVAARRGLFASFMPKPILSAAGSGMHVNLSLTRHGSNIFKNLGEGCSHAAESFIAGVLARTPDMTLFLNQTANSYERFGKFEAPCYISWSHQNRSQLIRIPAAAGERMRMELRSPDPATNPYLAFALILAAGLDGIEESMALPPAIDVDLYSADESVTKELIPLPRSLMEAVNAAHGSEFVSGVLGSELLSKYISVKSAEAKDFAAARDKRRFYTERYFGVI